MVDEWLALARRDQGRLAETKRGRSLGPLGSFVLATAACCGVLWGAADAAACTIGCATGAATFDGRPILTQSYDYRSQYDSDHRGLLLLPLAWHILDQAQGIDLSWNEKSWFDDQGW